MDIIIASRPCPNHLPIASSPRSFVWNLYQTCCLSRYPPPQSAEMIGLMSHPAYIEYVCYMSRQSLRDIRRCFALRAVRSQEMLKDVLWRFLLSHAKLGRTRANFNQHISLRVRHECKCEFMMWTICKCGLFVRMYRR